MKAQIRRNGGTVKDKLANLFIKIGIADEIEDDSVVVREKAPTLIVPKKAVVKKKKKK